MLTKLKSFFKKEEPKKNTSIKIYIEDDNIYIDVCIPDGEDESIKNITSLINLYKDQTAEDILNILKDQCEEQDNLSLYMAILKQVINTATIFTEDRLLEEPCINPSDLLE